MDTVKEKSDRRRKESFFHYITGKEKEGKEKRYVIWGDNSK